jgi:predicted dehydrogenase
MSTHVRVGVVGTSGYTEGQHLPYLNSHPQVQIAAICGRNQVRASELAGKYRIAQVYSDYRKMIELGDLDAVIVAAPDHLHHPITLAALDAGLHVLCEKPLATGAQLAKEMLDKAESAGLVHMTMYRWLWCPEYRQISDLICQGYIGQMRNVSISWLMSILRGPEYAWRIDAAYGHGVLSDIGSHMVDLTRRFAGEITGVAAHLSSHVARPKPDGQPYTPACDSAVLLLEFASGAHGTMQLSYTSHLAEGNLGEHRIDLYGSAGTIRSYANLDFSSLLGARENENHFQPIPVEARFRGDLDPALPFASRFFPLFSTESIGVRQFVDAILGKGKVATTFEDGWKACQVIDAALESHSSGSWVAVK